ncbi:MAG: carboxypeptidase regulatory-like domain-containing protein [Acidobacteriia bacterium]|nr:carboxypeptidase regulatory-like domain-containing protein [Terriglobia bacterium]
MKTMRCFLGTLICALAWIALIAGPVNAQVFTGDILGSVTDPTGAAVPDATITLRNQQTNATLETKSGVDGSYIFARMAPTTYEITVTARGFKRFVSPDNILRVGTRLTIDIKMQLGDVATSIEVTAAAALVKPDDPVLGQIITERSIVALPLNGRNFIQLAQLSPGVTEIGTAISPSQDWTGRANMAIVVEGLRETDTSYLLDGIETRSPRWGNTSFRPSVDAIQEFNIQRNAFTADQGWGATVVNTVIRSGTNEYHGSVFEFIRNGALDARNFFDGATKPPYKQNQWGATAGGPIKKDKLFFFADYEGFASRLTSTYLGRVPTPDMLQGQFTTPITDPQTGQPFPIVNGFYTIPPDRFDTVMKNVIPYYPAPNSPDPNLNYTRTAARTEDSKQIHARIDWNLPNNDRLYAHYSWLTSPLFQPGLMTGFGWNRPIGDENISLTYTHIFTPRMVNEFRIGYNRDRTYSNPESAFGPDLAKQIGLKNTTGNPADFGLPGFGPLSYSSVGIGFNQNQQTIDQIFQFNENLSYHVGKHDLKVGADIRRNRFFIVNDFPSNPSFSFYGTYSGNSVADFLLGLFDFTNEGVGDTSANFRRTGWSFYAQDSYKVTHKLSLTFGLRYEYPAPYTEINDKMGWLDFSTLEFVQVKDSGRDSMFLPDRNNFAPRFGFAYSPFGKWVLRGGFGVYHDLISGNETQFYGVSLPPISQIQSIFNTTPVPTYRVQDLFPATAYGSQTSPNTAYPSDRTPYIYMYNLNLEHEFKGVLFELGYTGSTGHKLNRRYMNNMARPGPEPMAERRLYPGFGDILTSRNDGWSNYSGMNLKVEKPFSKGLLLLASYTYGKHLDIGGPDEYVHATWFGLKDLRGPSSIDTRQRLVLSYVYELPVGRGKRAFSNTTGALDKLVGGWQVTGVTSFSSGHPQTLNLGIDWAGIGNRRMQPGICVGPVNDANLRSNIRNQPTLYPYFNVNNVLVPATGTMGNCGRGTVTAPGVNNWDMGLLKNTRITERVNVQFRAEFFNTWNHAQFGGLDTSPVDVNFGRITWARAPRDIQFGLKILF